MDRPRFILGLLLTAVAGAIDALTFTRFGAVYASFMSGNTVQVGLHVAEAQWATLGYFLTLVGCFMGGGFLGGVVMGTTGRWSLAVILTIIAALIGLALWLEFRPAPALALIAPLSLAMGFQNHLTFMVRGANPGTTFVTGTAFRFGDAVAQRVLGRDPHGAWRLHLAVWASFGLGAALGALSFLALQDLALVPIASVVGSMALVALVRTGAGAARRTTPSEAR